MASLLGFMTPMFLSLPGGSEWVIILLVILLIFGPKNLPKLGSAFGGFARNLKAGKEGEADDEDDDLEEERPVAKRRRSSEDKG